MSFRSAVGAVALGVVIAGCTAAGPGASAGGGQQASQGAGGGPSTAPAASSVPNPCLLISGAVATTAMTTAASSQTYAEGVLFDSNPANPFCRYDETNGGIGFALYLCTTRTCDFGIVRDVMGGDTVSGVGDDAFFQSTCDGPGLLGHDQLWATAKGLVFHLQVDCHTESALSLANSDKAMTDLMKVAITNA